MLNAKKLGEIISSLAEDLEIYTGRGYINSTNVEGAQYATLPEFKVYCLGSDVDTNSEHELCLNLLYQVIHDMPRTPANLIWRQEPEYATQSDFNTGRELHRVYLRLGWREV